MTPATCGNFGAQSSDEITQVALVAVAGFGLGSHQAQRPVGQGCGDFLVFDSDDFLQDVGHGGA